MGIHHMTPFLFNGIATVDMHSMTSLARSVGFYEFTTFTLNAIIGMCQKGTL